MRWMKKHISQKERTRIANKYERDRFIPGCVNLSQNAILIDWIMAFLALKCINATWLLSI